MTFEGVFVVIPAYNEASVLSAVLRGLTRRVPRRQIILVDDGSLDATSQVAAQEHVVVLRHRLNRGQGAALATGIQAALELGAQAIVTFDADGQHQPDDMPALLEPILQGHAAVVLGSRFLAETTEVPRLRAWVLKMGVVFTQLISRVKISDRRRHPYYPEVFPQLPGQDDFAAAFPGGGSGLVECDGLGHLAGVVRPAGYPVWHGAGRGLPDLCGHALSASTQPQPLYPDQDQPA
jgi:glycosyltransferase involved in cell wall biosynthesis